MVLVFAGVDNMEGHEQQQCQRATLRSIASCDQTVVMVNWKCTLLSWEAIKKPEESRAAGELLQRWGIVDRKVLYISGADGQ